MGALTEYLVLDTLIRAVNERIRRGEAETRVYWTALLNRIIVENDQVNEFSARPQTSKYLGNLLEDGYISKEKIGRNVYYDITAKGRFYHISNRDLLDPSREWLEGAENGIYFSYAVSPPEAGLIQERRDYSKGLEGKEILVEAVKLVKEMNPELDSIHIRVGENIEKNKKNARAR